MKDEFRDPALLVWLCGLLAVASAAWAGSLGHQGGFLVTQAYTTQWPNWLWESLTVIGDERVLLALALPFCWRQPRLFWGLIVAALVAGLIARGFKEALALPRPAGVLAEEDLTVIGHRLRKSAFPSGHTASAFAFAGILLLLYGRRIGALALALAALVGVSRVAVGAHWPLDVLAGAAIGLAGASCVPLLLRRWAWAGCGMRPRPLAWLVGVAALAVLTLPFEDQGYPDSWLLRGVVCAWGLGGLALSWRQRPATY